MNGVDRFDQLRAAHATERKEMLVPMSIFTFLLDASIINAYALYITMPADDGVGEVTLREFKRQIAESLVRPNESQGHPGKLQRDETEAACTPRGALQVRPYLSLRIHRILENVDGKRLRCYLCKLRDGNENMRTTYGCVECKLAFHVNFFTAFHNSDELGVVNDAVHQSLQIARK